MTRKPLPFLVGAAVLMIATQALSQPGLTLQKTNLRSDSPGFFHPCATFNTTFDLLLTPTAITCPSSSSNTCTFHIEVSSELFSLDVGASALFRVEVDNVPALPGGLDGAVTVATNQGVGPVGVINSKTFQFRSTGITPGLHTVEWLARTTSGTALACDRIQKVSIYTP
jgi:hypothetical protein